MLGTTVRANTEEFDGVVTDTPPRKQLSLAGFFTGLSVIATKAPAPSTPPPASPKTTTTTTRPVSGPCASTSSVLSGISSSGSDDDESPLLDGSNSDSPRHTDSKSASPVADVKVAVDTPASSIDAVLADARTKVDALIGFHSKKLMASDKPSNGPLNSSERANQIKFMNALNAMQVALSPTVKVKSEAMPALLANIKKIHTAYQQYESALAKVAARQVMQTQPDVTPPAVTHALPRMISAY